MNKILLLIVLLFLIGCQAFDDGIDKITQPDYVSSSKAKRLQIPPDLSDIDEGSMVYTVPGKAKSYKDYKKQQNSASRVVKIGIKSTDMKIVKSGALRWLVVKKNPNILWPHVKDFWEDMGFEVRKSSKRTGVMETEWIKSSELNQSNSGALTRFDQWLDSMSGFADRRKFRTRLEPGQEPNTTEIYLSQRSARSGTMEHERILADRKGATSYGTDKYKLPEYISEDKEEEKIKISDARNLDDFEIDSELLTRLMIKLGVSDFEAKKIVKNPTSQVHAEYIIENNSNIIKLNDPFDRSWRRLTLALDIIGFITEDKNRSKGILYVRYKNIELPGAPKDNEKGLLNTLAFWRDDEKEPNNKREITNIDPMAPKNKKGKSKEKDSLEEGKPNERLEVKKSPKENEIDKFKRSKKNKKKEGWIEKFSWGSEDEGGLAKDERRFRVRILPLEDGAKVYIDYPDEKINNTSEAQKILKIIYEHLK
jgi:outer membrane protein assembly factor BamC